MKDNARSDRIEYCADRVLHESAGGFVFFESPDAGQLYVALLQKPDGKYYIPKGHLLKGETSEQAALREVKEELLLDGTPDVIAKIGTDVYTFTLPGDHRTHQKTVHLYAFRLPEKAPIKPLEREGFILAEWLEIHEAMEKIAFDGKYLLKAAEFFRMQQ